MAERDGTPRMGGISQMRIFAWAGCILTGATCFAFAADISPGPAPTPPPVYAPAPFTPYSWTGFYIGANGGGGFASYTSSANIVGGLLSGASGSSSGNLTGAVAGGQLGANYQFNQLVLGIEGDFDWTDQSTVTNISILSETTKVPWLATVRGRAGFAIDHFLVYGTGGVAFGDVSDTITAPVGTIYSPSSTNFGWTVGAGMEYAFAQNFTIRAEYLLIGSNITLSGPLAIVGGTGTINATVYDNIVRAGINFKYP